MSQTKNGRGAVAFVFALCFLWLLSPEALSLFGLSFTDDPWDIRWISYPLWIPVVLSLLLVVAWLLFGLSDSVLEFFRTGKVVKADAHVEEPKIAVMESNPIPPFPFCHAEPNRDGDDVRADLERVVSQIPPAAPQPVEDFNTRRRRERLQQLFGNGSKVL